MNHAWPLVPLGEVLRKSNEWLILDPEVRYREVTVKLWGKGVVERRVAAGAEIVADRRLVVRPGQFILSRIDARNGAFGIVPDELDGAVVSNDFPVFTLDATRMLPAFLDWMSKTRTFVDLCQATSEGTTNRVRLKEDRFLATPVSLPPLEEQHRIVARIEALAAKVDEARRLRHDAEEQLSSGIASFHLRWSGDRVLPLAELLELNEQHEVVYPSESYPQVGVRGFGQGLFPKEALDGSATTYKVLNRLYEGAVVLSQVKGWEGAIGVCPAHLAGRFVSPEYRTFSARSGMALPQYLSVLFATPWFWSKLQALTRGLGGRRERTRPEHFLALSIPMPPLEDQIRGLRVFNKMDAVKRLQAETAAEWEALLPSILDRAFKGEL